MGTHGRPSCERHRDRSVSSARSPAAVTRVPRFRGPSSLVILPWLNGHLFVLWGVVGSIGTRVAELEASQIREEHIVDELFVMNSDRDSDGGPKRSSGDSICAQPQQTYRPTIARHPWQNDEHRCKPTSTGHPKGKDAGPLGRTPFVSKAQGPTLGLAPVRHANAVSTER